MYVPGDLFGGQSDEDEDLFGTGTFGGQKSSNIFDDSDEVVCDYILVPSENILSWLLVKIFYPGS